MACGSNLTSGTHYVFYHLRFDPCYPLWYGSFGAFIKRIVKYRTTEGVSVQNVTVYFVVFWNTNLIDDKKNDMQLISSCLDLINLLTTYRSIVGRAWGDHICFQHLSYTFFIFKHIAVIFMFKVIKLLHLFTSFWILVEFHGISSSIFIVVKIKMSNIVFFVEKWIDRNVKIKNTSRTNN